MRFIAFTLIAFLFLTPSVIAQEQVSVRSGVHPDYTRIVFDWLEPVEYSVSKTGQTIAVVFDKASQPDLELLSAQNLPLIQEIEPYQTSDGNLALRFQVERGIDYRHFLIGSRVVVDFKGPEGAAQKIASSAPPTPAPPEEKPDPVTAAPSETEEQKTAQRLEKELAPEVEKKEVIVETPALEEPPIPAPAQTILEQAVEESEPSVLTITSTSVLGAAAFRRSGFLWIAIDEPDLAIDPAVDGPDAASLGALEKYEIPGGKLFRLSIPDNYEIYPEGGDLYWRFIITPNERDITPLPLEKEFSGSQEAPTGFLVWTAPEDETGEVLAFQDPVIGDQIMVSTVTDSQIYAGPSLQFPEMQVLDSPLGLAVQPYIDDLSMASTSQGVVITKKDGGFFLSPMKDTVSLKLQEEIEEGAEEENPGGIRRIFNLARWQMGGLGALNKNQHVLLSNMKNKPDEDKVVDFLTLAKLNIAHNKSFEAIGFLRLAAQIFPDIEKNPEYKALQSVAYALSSQYDRALRGLLDKDLAPFTELDYWKAFTFAGVEDWQQAEESLPGNFDLLTEYPDLLRNRLVLALIEVALKSGRADDAEALLLLLEPDFPKLPLHQQAAWSYLDGEAKRQRGEVEAALEAWRPLLTSKDDLYRVRAGLSITRLEMEEGGMTPAKAIDTLEGLRFVWRGDDLESLINFRLGDLYIKNRNFMKGLSVLRNAASLKPDSEVGKQITEYMARTFESLYLDPEMAERVSPIEAVSVYDEFKELTPAGQTGDRLVESLAENLVKVDLLGRAADLLQTQVRNRLQGEEAGRVAIRLAAIRLLDDQPDLALTALDTAEREYRDAFEAQGEDTLPSDIQREITLLRARALSDQKKPMAALDALSDLQRDSTVNRLRTDIAIKASLWAEASDALQELIFDEDISLTRPLTTRQAELILNRAITLNLAGNRVGIANLRERYDDIMQQTPQYRIFEVVTRPRQAALIGNRSTITSIISEVDMFKEFLDTYRQGEQDLN